MSIWCFSSDLCSFSNVGWRKGIKEPSEARINFSFTCVVLSPFSSLSLDSRVGSFSSRQEQVHAGLT